MSVSINKEITQRVYDILCQYPDTRDSDRKLMPLFWESEFETVKPDYDKFKNNVSTFFEAYSNGKLSSDESIMRTRRRIQECAEKRIEIKCLGLVPDKSLIGLKRQAKLDKEIEIIKEIKEL